MLTLLAQYAPLNRDTNTTTRPWVPGGGKESTKGQKHMHNGGLLNCRLEWNQQKPLFSTLSGLKHLTHLPFVLKMIGLV